jgi:hypothetical protein
MKNAIILAWGLLVLFSLNGFGQSPSVAQSLQEQNEALLRQLQSVHKLTDEQMNAIRKIFARSGYISQGNPAITRHPVTPEECKAKLDQSGTDYENPKFEKICGGKYMAPLYNSATERLGHGQTSLRRP